MKDLLFINQSQPNTAVRADLNDIFLVGTDFATVEGPARKVQDITKILITAQGENFVYPSYGSTLPSLVGERSVAGLSDRIRESVIQALAFTQAIEQSTAKNERVRRIVSLQLDTTTDPRAISLFLVVELEDGTQITNSFPV